MTCASNTLPSGSRLGRARPVRVAVRCAVAAAAALLAGCNSSGPRQTQELGDAPGPSQLPTSLAATVDPSQDLITSRRFASGAYAGESGAFDLARDVLREEGFILDRVDAAAGIITTRPKTTAGLATPWDAEQSSAEQEIDDLANRQQRTVRITFEPVERASATTAPATTTPTLTVPTAPGIAAATSGTSEPTADEVGWTDLRQASLSQTSGEMRMSVRVIVERLNRPGWRVNPVSVRLSTYAIDTDLRQRGLSYQYAVARNNDMELAKRLADEIVLRRHRAETVAK